MDRERVEQLGRDIYHAAFAMLDAEPDIDGMDAGRIATATQRAFVDGVIDLEDEPEAQRQAREDAYNADDFARDYPKGEPAK